MILTTKWFGAFLCEEGKVRKAALFPKDPDEIARRLESIRKGEILEEEHQLAPSAKQVTDRRLSEFGKRVKFDSSFIKPEDYGFTLESYRLATIALAKMVVKSSVGPDVHLGQAVRAYSDLVYANNMLSERLREWYGLHFPELENVVTGSSYAKLVSESGSRDAVLAALNVEMESIGSDVEPRDMETIRLFAGVLRGSQSVRDDIENYIDLRMKEVAPNICALVGPVIGARLIMHAGSLQRLACMPAGTIQLLGAEKAMFRHLKEGSRPPKHGILFTHPMVRNSPGWQRGAISRALAAKLCLAARADAYTKNDISGLLKGQLEKRLSEIKKQRPNPPRRPTGKKSRRGGRR